MREIALFCEDSFHEQYGTALVTRLSRDVGVSIRIRIYSSRGGLPRMQSEFNEFLRDLGKGAAGLPDMIVLMADANCKGYTTRHQELAEVAARYPEMANRVVYGIPDPHIERWMLIDAQAFRTVIGRGCTLPAIKCAKDYYKELLIEEIAKADIESSLGGQEYAEDVVNVLDFGRASSEATFRHFLQALRGQFQQWKMTETAAI